MRCVVTRNVVSMFADPEESSEQVSQALLGECVLRLATHKAFAHVRTPDSYLGWVHRDALHTLPGSREYPDPGRGRMVSGQFAPVWMHPRPSAQRITLLTPGARVEAADGTAPAGYTGVLLPCGTRGYMRRADLRQMGFVPGGGAARAAARAALEMIGVPYVWGGRSTFGLDCSGLVQLAYLLQGVLLPRDAHQQAAWPGLLLVSPQGLAPGDLLFFGGRRDSRGREITHVGIALGDGSFVHACGGRGAIVSPVNDPSYQKRLRVAGRVVSM